ncbi:hypothetical protein GTW62_27590 [Streptomyces sp. SID5614]|nr:hypothetical protein [Streptomyces sp. SID5614]
MSPGTTRRGSPVGLVLADRGRQGVRGHGDLVSDDLWDRVAPLLPSVPERRRRHPGRSRVGCVGHEQERLSMRSENDRGSDPLGMFARSRNDRAVRV